MDTEVFEKGREALKAGDYKAADRAFSEVMKSVDEHHRLYNKVVSFHGLAQVLVSDPNGLLLCRDAASSEIQDGDVFLNLACAEWHSENTKRAVDAVLRGRKIDSAHDQLVRAGALIDSQRRNILPFLPGEHLLNRILGRLMRQYRDELRVHDLMY